MPPAVSNKTGDEAGPVAASTAALGTPWARSARMEQMLSPAPESSMNSSSYRSPSFTGAVRREIAAGTEEARSDPFCGRESLTAGAAGAQRGAAGAGVQAESRAGTAFDPKLQVGIQQTSESWPSGRSEVAKADGAAVLGGVWLRRPPVKFGKRLPANIEQVAIS